MALTGSLAGCASAPAAPPKPTTEGDTSYRSVAKDDLQHYRLALGEVSTGAIPHDHPAPVYPAALLDQRLPPREVEARVIVDEVGRVSDVRIADEAGADPATRLFDEAVRAAAMQWTFEPLRVSQWAADANGNTHEVGHEARPFSTDYVFRFAWKDGKPVADASVSSPSSK
jgi:TonB family protein